MIETETALAPLDTDVRYRLRVLHDDAAEDDRAVALGLLAAGRAGGPETLAEPGGDRAAVARILDRVDGRDRALFYDAWYRMKIPYGEAEPDSWYVLALALGRTSGDLPAALDLHARVLLLLADAEDPAAVFAREFGLTGEPAGTLKDAVLAGAPFLRATPKPWRARLRDRALAVWTGLREEERPLLLLEFRQRVEGLEQVRFFLDGRTEDNRGVGAVLQRCASTDPAAWTDSQLAVATLALMWREAGFCLQELNQSIISLPLVADFVVRRVRAYEQVLGIPPAPLPEGIADLARLYGGLRVRIERDHLRCLQFDGSNWERREFLVPRRSCAEALPLPATLRGRLETAFGAPLAGEGPAAWAAAVDNAVAAGLTPTDVIRTLGAWAVADELLPVDYAIFTAPMSNAKLAAPWTLDYEDVFCYTAFAGGFDWSAEGVPFDFVRIANAIGQRLRYNVVKKAQNYTLVRRFKAQSFNVPDIAVAEDANHEGHRAAGIRMSCRVPTHVHHEGITWKGLADIRLNRTFYREHLEFRPSDIPAASRLAEWLGWIADAVYERGLEFDAKYGKKLPRTEGAA
ncbi:hypothetical protein AGRA3207_002273 [Actinomadura graeca]|uniref:Uncharacterized protein n=1 Tax=Actinomadura graeca TaxID=2750812 RepID=A0ABX8QRU3_9ACTN|nr:hypothetical protein [Actinomadura graeca]QXJ21421.1 hypothetical protein AGRA3207_002273 [Actinomadura graeca]